jgi:hypothetical protein
VITPEGTKRCSLCREYLPLDRFYKNKAVKDGVQNLCKPCQESRRKITQGPKVREQRLQRSYGIGEADWWLMLEAQEWACKICSRPWKEEDAAVTWATDHDHSTGQVRGVLCRDCNTALGLFQDSSKLLRQAAMYLVSA